MNSLTVGELVQVTDIGLASLRAIMPDAGPNHYGAVAGVGEDGQIMVLFPIGDDDPAEHGQVVPYDSRDVLVRTEARPIDAKLRAAALAYAAEFP